MRLAIALLRDLLQEAQDEKEKVAIGAIMQEVSDALDAVHEIRLFLQELESRDRIRWNRGQ